MYFCLEEGMYAINNLLKTNDFIEKKLNLDELSLEELKKYYLKYKSLKDNQKLMNSLSDRGEKIKIQLNKLHVRKI
jgi:hypothetical protein